MALNPAQATDKLLNLAQSKMKLATVRTLNRLADSVNSKAASEIARDLAIRNKDVKAALRVAKARAADNDIKASVTATGERIPLIAFVSPGRRQVGAFLRQAGVGYRIGSGGQKTRPGTFIAKMQSGHIGVFFRTGRFGRRKNPKLEKINEARGPSIPKSFVSRKVQAALHALIETRMVKEMAANARFYAGKIGIGADVV